MSLKDLEDRITALLAERNAICEINDVKDAKIVELTTTSQRRKEMIDKMAFEMQNTVNKHNDSVKTSKTLICEKDGQIKSLKAQVSEINAKYEKLERNFNELSSHSDVLGEQLNEEKEHVEKLKKMLEEAECREKVDFKIKQSEHELVIRDLKSQLECSKENNGQLEENAATVQADLEDRIEQHKIEVRKYQRVIKELRKEIKGRMRGEEINNMRKSSHDFSNLSSLSLSESFSSNNALSSYLDREANSSNSGTPTKSQFATNITEYNTTKDPVNGEVIINQSATAHNDTTTDHHESSNILLLEKVGKLQNEIDQLQAKVDMLEHSSSSMAEELLNKSEIIKRYCMSYSKQRDRNITEESKKFDTNNNRDDLNDSIDSNSSIPVVGQKKLMLQSFSNKLMKNVAVRSTSLISPLKQKLNSFPSISSSVEEATSSSMIMTDLQNMLEEVLMRNIQLEKHIDQLLQSNEN